MAATARTVMDFTTFRHFNLRRDGHVLHASFNKPEAMNAIDQDVHAELDRLVSEVGDDDATNVLVLTGEGRAFSAGGNIDAMQELIDRPKLFLDELNLGRKLLFSILDCPKPIIAKVNGAAMGLGATVALFCDIVIAAKHAKIADPHVKLGFSAGDGGAVIWPALMGYARARRYLFTGDPVTGETAAAMGLIDSAVDAADLDATVDELAQRIAGAAPRAVQWTKLSVNIALKQVVHSVIDASLAYEALSNQTQDHQEAVNAFIEKRAPNFTGE